MSSLAHKTNILKTFVPIFKSYESYLEKCDYDYNKTSGREVCDSQKISFLRKMQNNHKMKKCKQPNNNMTTSK